VSQPNKRVIAGGSMRPWLPDESIENWPELLLAPAFRPPIEDNDPHSAAPSLWTVA